MKQLQQNLLNFKLNILLEHDPNKQFSLTPYLPLPVPDNCRRPPGEWERHLQPVVDESGPRELPDHDLEGVRGALAAAISADQGEAPSADTVLINGSVCTVYTETYFTPDYVIESPFSIVTIFLLQ